jgi:hypothetical protein
MWSFETSPTGMNSGVLERGETAEIEDTTPGVVRTPAII